MREIGAWAMRLLRRLRRDTERGPQADTEDWLTPERHRVIEQETVGLILQGRQQHTREDVERLKRRFDRVEAETELRERRREAGW